MRLGELSAPDRGTLTVPYCVPLPLRRPIWVDSTSSKAALGLISAVTVRVMAAGPMPLLDVVDLTGSLTPLTDRLAPMLAGPVITAHTEISARLRALAEAVDMGELARMSGVADGPSSLRLLILSDFPHGYSAEDAQTIMFLAERGPGIGLSILIVGEDESNFAEESVAALSEGCQHLSAAGQTEVHDPVDPHAMALHPGRARPDLRVANSGSVRPHLVADGGIAERTGRVVVRPRAVWWRQYSRRLMAFWDQLKAKAQEMNGQLKTKTSQFQNKEFKNASMAMCALIAAADGSIDPSERQKTAALIMSNESLAVFPPDELREQFDWYCSKLSSDYEFGKVEATATIAKLKSKQDQARAVIQIGIIIGGADGNFDEHERGVVRDMCLQSEFLRPSSISDRFRA